MAGILNYGCDVCLMLGTIQLVAWPMFRNDKLGIGYGTYLEEIHFRKGVVIN